MTTVLDILEDLCALAPLELQEDFDNAGFLLGRGGTEVKKALLSLDVTGDVIDEAATLGAQLIISHHPVIFHPLKALTDAEPESELLLRLAERHIAVISMHTNLDIAEGGVNDVLLKLLGAQKEGCLDSSGCGRTGFVPECGMQDFLSLCKTKLQTAGLRFYDAGRPVRHIAVMGGAGGDSIKAAHALGCDTYLTSDIKYHQFLLAKELGINLIDGDHYSTEAPVMSELLDRLSKAFPTVSFRISEVHRQVIRFA